MKTFFSLLFTTAPSCVEFLTLRGICHSLAAWWKSSCSHQCCCWQRSPWAAPQWSPAESVCDPGSRRSPRGRVSGYPYRNTPGQSSHSRLTGSSMGSRAILRCVGAQNIVKVIYNVDSWLVTRIKILFKVYEVKTSLTTSVTNAQQWLLLPKMYQRSHSP